MPNLMKSSGLRWLWLGVLTLVLDQLSKWAIVSSLAVYQQVEVMPFFNLTHVHNPGAAFSFLGDASGWQRWFFTAIAIGVSALLLVWLKKNDATQWKQNSAFALILGGAIGNVIDRLIYGHVIDFLDVYVGSYHWPAFNIADSAICIGAALLIWDAMGHSKAESKVH